MRYFDYLKRRFPFYIIGGVILSLAAFSLITVHRFNNHFSGILQDMNTINIKKAKVRKQIEEIDSLTKYFKDRYDMDPSNVDPDAYILRSLDELGTNLTGSSVTVGEFARKGADIELPVEIKTKISNDAMIVHYVRYIESLRIPNFRIMHLNISKGQRGEAILFIKGALTMPSLVSNT